MKRILIFVDSFTVGGTSSSILALLRTVDKTLYHITLSYFDADPNLLEQLPDSITLLKKTRPALIRRAFGWISSGLIIEAFELYRGQPGSPSFMSAAQRTLQQAAKQTERNKNQYDIAIAGMELLSTYYVAFCIEACKKIAWIHTNYTDAKLNPQNDESVYAMFDSIVTVSEECKDAFDDAFPGYRGKSICIPNIVDEIAIKEMANQQSVAEFECNILNVLTVARIDNKSKRFDRIIRACLYFRNKGFSFKWYIVGDGPDRGFVENTIAKHQLGSRLILLGQKDNPYPYMKSADVFVLLSSYEGRPISITEAMILGCPIVTTDFAAVKKQVPQSYGAIIPNRDETISENLYNVLSDGKALRQWRANLREFSINNSLSIKRFLSLMDVDEESMN